MVLFLQVTTSTKACSLRTSPGGKEHLVFIKWAFQGMPGFMICTSPSFFGGSLESMPGAPCSSGPDARNRDISPASLLPSHCSSDFVKLVPKAGSAPDAAQDIHFYSTLEIQVANAEILLRALDCFVSGFYCNIYRTSVSRWLLHPTLMHSKQHFKDLDR